VPRHPSFAPWFHRVPRGTNPNRRVHGRATTSRPIARDRDVDDDREPSDAMDARSRADRARARFDSIRFERRQRYFASATTDRIATHRDAPRRRRACASADAGGRDGARARRARERREADARDEDAGATVRDDDAALARDGSARDGRDGRVVDAGDG
jgi:hypothetical protein